MKNREKCPPTCFVADNAEISGEALKLSCFGLRPDCLRL